MPPPKRRRQAAVSNNNLSDVPKKRNKRESPVEDESVMPLLSLPDVVLQKVISYLSSDDLRALSQTCRRLRNLTVYAELPVIDQRRTVETCRFMLPHVRDHRARDDSSRTWRLRFSDSDSGPTGLTFECRDGSRWHENYVDSRTFRDYMEKMSTQVFIEKVLIVSVPWSRHLKMSKIVESVTGFSDSINIHSCSCGEKQLTRVAEFVEAFCVYPKVDVLTMVGLSDDQWDQYSSTVTHWANANGLPVENRDTDDKTTWSFRKEMVNGRLGIVITHFDIPIPYRMS